MKKTIHKIRKSASEARKKPARAIHSALQRLGGARPAVQATILASVLLVASAVFLSQTDKIFAKAASSNIRGTMVLMDKPSSVLAVFPQFALYPSNVLAPISLPGTSCTLQITACSDELFTSSGVSMRSPDLFFDNGIKKNGVVSGDTCTDSGQFITTGGIHTVRANVINANTQFTTDLSTMTVAYDCTP